MLNEKVLLQKDEIAVSDSSLAASLQGLGSGKYIFRDRNEIMLFLTAHNFLISLLDQAYTQIRNIFRFEPLYIEFISDSENSGSDHLTVFIQVNKSLDQALSELTLLHRSWWFEALRTLPPQERGLLNINLEFQSNEL